LFPLSKLQRKYIALFAGLAIALFLYFVNPFSVSDNAARVLAIAGLMITWWVTEALPMPVVALLPLILFPLFNIAKLEDTAAPYANPVIFLFMGGFMLGLAIEKWNLHKRIALNIVRLTGTSGNRIVLGFILATGLLSMWLSNTATTMMMFPIALSVIHVMKENHTSEKAHLSNFSLTIMLAIAYASNIGGIATIIGTPPNVAYVGYMEKNFPSLHLSFVNWMMICTPLAILLLFSLYWVMVKWLFPNRIQSDSTTKRLIKEELVKLGPLSVSEKRVLIIFAGTAFLWITRDILNKHVFPWLGKILATDLFSIRLDDTIIAILCAVALFICPSGKNVTIKEEEGSLLEWSDTSKMAWGILLLFGGGIALANVMEKAGLIEDLGQWLAHFSHNPLILLIAVTIVSIFISEVMSNIAQVIVFAPVVSALAVAVGMNPVLLGIPMTLAASCAGMLPMGTPPNAIVFASGHIKFRQMVKAGLVMNIISIIFIILFSWFLLPLLIKN
jgi:sodium-dependent dicarboxylate transporter 2/3/5